MKSLYLDAAAGVGVSHAVGKAIETCLRTEYGNPSSLHALGEEARKALDSARANLGKELNARAHEITFTSGATESNNLAILGLAQARPNKKKIIISAIEHASILEPCAYLAPYGYEIVRVPVHADGRIDLITLERALDGNTLLVSIMHVNNIVGTIQDIRTIGALCASRGIPFHTDAAQSFGKLKLDVRAMNIDMLSASGHKRGGPKGVGFLYSREGLKLAPVLRGGGQERGVRSGTENVPGAVGFAHALKEKQDGKKIQASCEALMLGCERLGGIVNGSREHRMYNNVHVSFPGQDGEMLVSRLSGKGIYASVGSACDARGEKEDHVLKALGLSPSHIKGSIRMTLNEPLSRVDVARIVACLSNALKKRA